MKKSLVALAVLSAAAVPSFAALSVLDLYTGPGNYSITDTTQDGAFGIALTGGKKYVINLTSLVGNNKTTFTNVWLSSALDKTAGGTNDYMTFASGGQSASGSFILDLTSLSSTKTKTVYLDVVATKLKHAGYSGTFTVAVAAVPEPASTALFLAGLGALGIVSRRRKPQA